MGKVAALELDQPRMIKWICLAILLACLCFQAVLSTSRYINPDEGQHLIIMRSIEAGQVDYRDFFDHHGPLYAYLFHPLLGLSDSAGSIILVFRIVSLLCWLAALALLFALARMASKDPHHLAAWICVVLWCTCFISYITAIDIRPEALQVPLTLASLLLLLMSQQRSSLGLSAAAGLSSGLTLLAGPRAVFIGIAFFAIILLQIFKADRQARRRSLKSLLVFCLCAAMPMGAAILLFARAGALNEFFSGFFRYNLAYHYAFELPVANYLREDFSLNPELWLLGIAGAVWSLVRPSSHARQALAVVLVIGLMTLLVTPMASPQHVHGVILPFLAVNAGLLVADILAAPGSWYSICALAFVALAICTTYLYKPVYFSAPSLLHCSPWLVVPVVAGLGLLICTLLILRPKLAPLFLVPVLLTWMSYLTLASATAHSGGGRYSDRRQLAAIERIAGLNPGRGRVLDGFSGLAFMQPAFDYYFALHDHAIDMIGPERLRRRLRARMSEEPPAVVIVDRYQRYLWRTGGSRAASLPFFVLAEPNDLWEVLADYRLAFSLYDQVVYAPEWSLKEVDVFVHHPSSRQPPAVTIDPSMRSHRTAEDRFEVLYPDRVDASANTVPVALALDPQFRSGALRPVLRWKASFEPTCPVRGRWRWRCTWDARTSRAHWRYVHDWEIDPAGAKPFLGCDHPVAVRAFTSVPGLQGLRKGVLGRAESSNRLFALFSVPLPTDVHCVAFSIELHDPAGDYRVRPPSKDFWVQRAVERARAP